MPQGKKRRSEAKLMDLVESTKKSIKRAFIRRLLRKDALRRSCLNSRFDGLGPELWDCGINVEGRLTIQEVDAATLAEKYGTPLHVVDKNRLLENYKNFVGAFRRYIPRVVLATSYKTNPLPGVISVLHRAGTWAEVISHFELWLAIKLGVPPERIILNGPGKGKECIEKAVAYGVGLINIDGREEIPWLAESAGKKGTEQNVGLRLVTSVGWTGQFGTRIDTGESMDTFRELIRYPQLKPRALHLHLGTGIKEVSSYIEAIREVLLFSESLKKELGVKIDIYDFGGGFGVPTVGTPDAWDLRMPDLGFTPRMPFPADCPAAEDYAIGILRIMKRIRRGSEEKSPLIILEPGRAITSSAQILLLSVVTVKKSQGLPDRLILDGGKNITVPLAYETHQIFPAGKMLEMEKGQFDLYGPLCHPGDVVARLKKMPDMHAGDLVAIMDAGAYFVPNQMNFSQPRPSVVMIDGQEVYEIRARESFLDIVRLDDPFTGLIANG